MGQLYIMHRLETKQCPRSRGNGPEFSLHYDSGGPLRAPPIRVGIEPAVFPHNDDSSPAILERATLEEQE